MKSKIVKSIKVGAVLFLGAGLLMGCLNSTPEPAKTPVVSTVEKTTPVTPEVPQTTTPDVSTINASTADSKNSTEKVQESVSQAVADGTYADTTSYMSPGGRDLVDFSVSVKGDVVTAVSVTPKDVDETSSEYIAGFSSEISNVVVGKKINELNLPLNVAGASLTTAAFKAYVEKVVAEN